MKDTLGLEFPNLPDLLDGNVKLTETNAIMKYIANKLGPHLLGSDAKSIATVEMVSNGWPT